MPPLVRIVSDPPEHMRDLAAAVPPPVAHTLRRIAREATTNILKHASARTLTCRLRIGREGFGLRVEDDGRGLPADVEGGQGLGIMQRRVARLEGRVTTGNRAEGGAFVEAEIPAPR